MKAKRERKKSLTRMVGARITEEQYQDLLKLKINITEVLREALRKELARCHTLHNLTK